VLKYILFYYKIDFEYVTFEYFSTFKELLKHVLPHEKGEKEMQVFKCLVAKWSTRSTAEILFRKNYSRQRLLDYIGLWPYVVRVDAFWSATLETNFTRAIFIDVPNSLQVKISNFNFTLHVTKFGSRPSL